MDDKIAKAILDELRKIKKEIELLNANLPNIPNILNSINDTLARNLSDK